MEMTVINFLYLFGQHFSCFQKEITCLVIGNRTKNVHICTVCPLYHVPQALKLYGTTCLHSPVQLMTPVVLKQTVFIVLNLWTWNSAHLSLLCA